MGKIYCIIGKSAAGKDSLFSGMKKKLKNIEEIVQYTTRPPREGESEGESYHFVSDREMQEYEKKGRIIEIRSYKTIHGLWKYATIDDGRIDVQKKDYMIVGTLEAYIELRKRYGMEVVVPLYIEVDDGERLMRALKRERRQSEPRYEELCRRFLADAEDFSEEKLALAGITKRYRNTDSRRCLEEIAEDIKNGKL